MSEHAKRHGGDGHSVEGGLIMSKVHVEGSRLMVWIGAKDRPGLLHLFLKHVTAFDQSINIVSGMARLCQDVATIFLIMSPQTSKNVHQRLDALGRHILSYEHAPGSTINKPVVFMDIRIDSPDKPRGLEAICELIDQMDINIGELLINPIELGERAESEDEPNYNLTLTLNLWQTALTFELIEENLRNELGVTAHLTATRTKA